MLIKGHDDPVGSVYEEGTEKEERMMLRLGGGGEKRRVGGRKEGRREGL